MSEERKIEGEERPLPAPEDVVAKRRLLAQDVLREMLEEARREAESEAASGERMRALVHAGKTSGLTAAELARRSGLSRPAIYEVLSKNAQSLGQDLDEVVLATIAARGATTRSALASALGLDEEIASPVIDELCEEGAASLGSAGYDPSSMQEIVMLGPRGEMQLRRRLRRGQRSRPDHWTAYLAVEPAEAAALLAAAEERFGPGRAALIPQTTTSSMVGPELAIAFDVGDLVELFNQAAAAWLSLRAALSLEPVPPRIAAFSPPKSSSAVLEAVVLGVAGANPRLQERAMAAISGAIPPIDDVTICERALRQAAWALRRLAGQDSPPPELTTGDAAFDELQAVAALHLDRPRELVQEALVRALKLATDRLGPFPGGRMSHFRAPGERPHLVEEVAPTPSDLVDIAAASGEALGHAAAVADGEIDAMAAIATILAPPPSR